MFGLVGQSTETLEDLRRRAAPVEEVAAPSGSMEYRAAVAAVLDGDGIDRPDILAARAKPEQFDLDRGDDVDLSHRGDV
jgi:hypothetical protein